MANYTRSRSKFYRDDPEGPGGSYPPRGGRNYTIYIIAAIVLVVLVVAVVWALKSCSTDTSTPPDDYTTGAAGDVTETPADTSLPEDTSMIEATATPDAMNTPADGETTQPDATGTPVSGETVQPDATATPDSGETAQPDATASAAPTATPDSGSSSSGGDASALTPEAIKGTPDVNEYLPLRESASSTGTELAKIQKDEEFTVVQVSTNKAWLKVKYNDKTGYVMAKYVKIGSGSDKVCTVTSSTINVRSGAGKTKDIVGTLKSGDTVVVTDTVTASSETWYKITIGDTTGYVFAQYCRLSS